MVDLPWLCIILLSFDCSFTIPDCLLIHTQPNDIHITHADFYPLVMPFRPVPPLYHSM